MGQMISPRESVHYEERGGPGKAEHLIAEEWRMCLQKQQRSTRKNRMIVRHGSQEKRGFVSGKTGWSTVSSSLRKLKMKSIC